MQQHVSIMRQRRAYLDSVIEFYPIVGACLMQHARILHSPFSVSAVTRIQDYHEEKLTTLEKRAARPLFSYGADKVDDNAVSDSVVERALKRLRTSTTTKKADYMDTRYLITNSNCCERLFISVHAFSNHCRRILSMNFERRRILYMNDKYWGNDDVKVTVNTKANPESSED